MILTSGFTNGLFCLLIWNVVFQHSFKRAQDPYVTCNTQLLANDLINNQVSFDFIHFKIRKTVFQNIYIGITIYEIWILIQRGKIWYL